MTQGDDDNETAQGALYSKAFGKVQLLSRSAGMRRSARMPYADNGHATPGLWPLGAVRIEVFVVALRTRRYDLKLSRWQSCGQELAFIGSRKAHRPGPDRIPAMFVGFDEQPPIGKTFLEGTHGVVIQVIATRSDGGSEQGVQLTRGDAKLPLEHADGSARDEVEGSHAAGVHERNEGGMQSVEHDGETIGGKNAQGRVGQRGNQRIGLDAGEAALQRRRINNVHPVSVDLAHRMER